MLVVIPWIGSGYDSGYAGSHDGGAIEILGD